MKPQRGEVSLRDMPQSLSQIYLHLVFSVKNRQPFIDKSIRSELYAYMAAVLYDECESSAIIVGGIEDHVHVLLRLSRTCTVAHLVEIVKKRSSKWIKTKGDKYRLFQWQTGYGVFSVSRSNLDAVRRYIQDQEEHHERRTFEDEFIEFLNKHEVEYDERYVWD